MRTWGANRAPCLLSQVSQERKLCFTLVNAPQEGEIACARLYVPWWSVVFAPTGSGGMPRSLAWGFFVVLVLLSVAVPAAAQSVPDSPTLSTAAGSG